VTACVGLIVPCRTVYEDSGPGRPLSCLMEEPAPYTDGTGAAAGGGNCRFVESPSQDQRLQTQRLRNPDVRGSLQTPQNRPHGHQSPELPEGYGEAGPCPPCGFSPCATALVPVAMARENWEGEGQWLWSVLSTSPSVSISMGWNLGTVTLERTEEMDSCVGTCSGLWFVGERTGEDRAGRTEQNGSEGAYVQQSAQRSRRGSQVCHLRVALEGQHEREILPHP
jgi:hypothetical protein